MFQRSCLEFGVDEAGRGPLAGPVVVAACYLPVAVDGVMDSKAIATEDAREEVYERLIATPGVRYVVAKCEPAIIDDLNILQATLLAMRVVSRRLANDLHASSATKEVINCVSDEELKIDGDFRVLVDGNKDPFADRPCEGLESKAIIGGDATVPSISAASVIAKVTRDRIMNAIDRRYPQYLFKTNKGYGTADHRRLITKHGWISGLHRTSFNPVKSLLLSGHKPSGDFSSSSELTDDEQVPPDAAAPDDDDKRAPPGSPDDDDLASLGVADLRARCIAAGLSSTVSRTDGVPGPSRIKNVLLARLRPPPNDDVPQQGEKEPLRRSKRLRASSPYF